MHPVQGGFHSKISNVDIEAMKAAHNSAITSNEKIFPVFAKRFASKDPKEFINTARKLAVWLNSERAYYPAARPKIIELLEIALSTCRDFMHHPVVPDLAEHLQLLVRAVTPFKHMFPDNELQLRLRHVISETTLFLSKAFAGTTKADSPNQESVTAHVPVPMLASPARPQSTIPSAPGTDLSVLRLQITSSIPSDPNGSAHTDLLQATYPPEVVSSNQIKAVPSLASPVADTSQDASENILPSKPQPKRIRRTELLEDLVARDLDWFKSNQGLSMANGDGSSPKAGQSLPTQSPSPRRKTFRMVPSRRLPRRILLNSTQEVGSLVPASTSPPSSEPLAEQGGSYENGLIEMDVDEQNPPLEVTKSDINSTVPAIPDAQDVSRLEDLLPPGAQLAVVPSIGPPAKPQILQTDHQLPLVEGSSTNGENPISVYSSPSFPDALTDKTKPMDSASESGSENFPSGPPCKLELELTPPPSPQMLQLQSPILPPSVNTLQPPLNLNFQVSQIVPGQPQRSGIDAEQRRFDDVSIIYTIQGKPFTHTHIIDVSLNENVFFKISKWIKRKSHPSEASKGACVSLACYLLPEVFDTIKSEHGQHEVEALMSQSSCSWPSFNRLSLHVNDKEKHTIITLSPPFFLTPDRGVDISSLMKPGNNTLEIRQIDDLSDYLIVLHAHRPTRAQLAELDVVKSADERWRHLLDAISGRVLPGRMERNASLDIVGVS